MDYRDLCLECEERHHAWFCNKYHDPLWVSVKKCSKNPINKDTKQISSEIEATSGAGDLVAITTGKSSNEPVITSSKLEIVKNKESDNMTRLEELANMTVDSGGFLKFDNGYSILFQIVDFENIPEVKKMYEGKPAGNKHQWSIILKEVKIMSLPTVQYKREMNPDKCNKIEGQQVNKKYILELGKKATKKLSTYCIDHNIKSIDILKFWRTGEQAQTIYNFMKEYPPIE